VARRELTAWAVAIAVLVAGGLVYRVVTHRVLGIVTKKIILPLALANFPDEIGGWTGRDMPLTPEVERIAGNDDYLNRLYRKPLTEQVANLYIAYSGRPRTMVGHMPQVCYVNAGWVLDETRRDELTLPPGRRIPCLVHRFHQAPPNAGEVVVLNYYVLNGVATNDESSFAGVGWRLPNFEGNPAWYVAQIQVSSRSEGSARELAQATAERILEFLPDQEGKVRAAEGAGAGGKGKAGQGAGG
jgi:EpsI family protein